jgi:hypothetical protein
MNAIFHRFVGALLVALIIVSLLTGAVFAQDAPDTLPETGAANRANEYITQLDQLRMLGARSAAADYLAHPGVYDYSSDLQTLNAGAANRVYQAYIDSGANAYVTTLDQLRSMR